MCDHKDDLDTLGRYQLLARINAVHARAARARDTDWSQIVRLYSLLEAIDANPIVTLNKAVAVSEFDAPEVALAIVERLGGTLDGHHAFHATRAELLRRVGRAADARAAYDRAIELAGNTAEIAHLTRRRAELAAVVPRHPDPQGGPS